MKVIEEPRHATWDHPHTEPLSAEALIRGARQRQRRRWIGGGIVLLVIVVGSVSYLIVSRPSGRARQTGASSSTTTISPTQSGAFVSPKAPYALAVAPNGDLLVVDSGRDQILRRLPSGRFQVVAGTGKRGFSGDGGQAILAEIDDPSGIAAAKNSTIYFSDEGNGRVREIMPDGIIETVAGGGTIPLGTKPVAALSAKFPAPSELFGLAIGPNGELYIGTSAVYRLSPNGILDWVVGSSARVLNKGFNGIYSNPAFQIDFNQAKQLALDTKGDLVVAGGYGFGLYERTASGSLRFLAHFRDGASTGSLATAPDGTVVLAGGNVGLARFQPSGSATPIAAHGLATVLGPQNEFLLDDSVAVAANGDIYLDVDAGWFSSVSAIVELRPNGNVLPLWKS
ncbi:MAG: hypothetical protein ABSD85_15050 [Acidimicrobiales bacterium]